VVNFDAQQMLNEWLRNVLVAENESEHNRICNVKVVKRLDIHWYFPFALSCGALPLS
jgi:hypothetical protein